MKDGIKNIVVVDIDDFRKDSPIIVGRPDGQETESEGEQIIIDMATLCEGVCTLIHWAEDNGYKSSADSLRDCISHLKAGFSDATYKTRSGGE